MPSPAVVDAGEMARRQKMVETEGDDVVFERLTQRKTKHRTKRKTKKLAKASELKSTCAIYVTYFSTKY